MKYTGEYTKEISFPLGGIGSGSIGIGGDGRFIDWEIFNKPSKGSLNGYSHFAVKAVSKNRTVTKILNGDLLKDFSGQFSVHNFGTGPSGNTLAGFPHFNKVEFDGEFPIATLTFSDDVFPGKVILTAFNPFIPLNEDDSSIPAAFFNIEIINDTNEDITYYVALSVANPYENGKNEYLCANGKHFIKMTNIEDEKNSPEYGDISIATDSKAITYQTYWYRGGWQDNIVTFWNEFSADSELKDRNYDSLNNSKTLTKKDHATLCAKLNVCQNNSGLVRFVLSWNSPNMYAYWLRRDDPNARENNFLTPWKNYYAVLFKDSFDSANYSLENWDRLYNDTKLFKDTLFSSTLEPVLLDAISSNLSVLKSPTVFRLEDGSFYGWEGCYQNHGSCEGTCEHVWNYAYALCFLFPKLERSIRDYEFKQSTSESGLMHFRTPIPFGAPKWMSFACLDGQMGSVIKSYREWKISGDDEWLKNSWPDIKKVLEFAWSPENPHKWDLNKDGILEGRQHHTLDMELFGPSSWLMSMYMLALKVGAEMAEFMGEKESAEEYLNLYSNGCKFMNEQLFNGEYFDQKVDLSDKSVVEAFGAVNTYWNEETKQIKYQIAGGSSIDQMLGQWHSYILGTGRMFDSDKMQIALNNMMKYNFIPSMRNFANPWRIFCLNDEGGAIMCGYPDKVTKPAIPVPYCEENMTGFEYSFAGLLFAAGKMEDGLKVVKAVRDRYDGEKRNPWNEIECGSNYARTMASFSFLPLLSGFEFDLSKGHIGFAPKVNKENFKCLFSLGTGWGYFENNENSATVKLNAGELTLCSLSLKNSESVKGVSVDGVQIPYTFKDGLITFDKLTVKNYIRVTL